MATTSEKLNAKHTGEETGIEIKRTICEVCSRGCGVDAYVKDGKIIKVEGTEDNPTGFGYLCQKGQANRAYIYRDDRIKTPLRRTGPRGSGQFEAISWDEAYAEIARKLNGYKKDFGANSVVFFTGYTKWYRPMYMRFIYSFGSQNYCTDDSVCYYSTYMANKINSGTPTRPDLRNCRVFLGWSFNRYYSGSIVETKRLEYYKEENGMKVVIIDPRITPASIKLADIHLRPLPGTDGALALGFAKIFIESGKIDQQYIDEHVYGFKEYAEYVRQFDLDTVSKITTVPKKDILEAAKMLTENGPMAISESASPLVHHVNGMQNYRAIMALSAITGNYDRDGGQIPLKFADGSYAGYGVIEDAFSLDTFPYRAGKKVGAARFPLWAEIVEQGQSVDLARQIIEKDPYPIKAIFALGMNYRMLPNDKNLLKAFDELEFFVDTDIFMTDTAKFADIVLPACSGFERGTFRNYGNGKVAFTKPVIEPLYESKSDVDILCELARVMDIDDPLLKSGYHECCRFMLSQTGLTIEELQAAEKQVQIPTFKNYPIGLNTRTGYATTTGKYELKSKIIERYAHLGLDPLPTYKESIENIDPEKYPLILLAGGRLPNAMHSRFHDVKWNRSLRPFPMSDIHPEDAEALGISQGDDIWISTPLGRIGVKANLTYTAKKGVAVMFQGYREADVNSIIPDKFDPYSGYPGYRSARCSISKKNNTEETKPLK